MLQLTQFFLVDQKIQSCQVYLQDLVALYFQYILGDLWNLLLLCDLWVQSYQCLQWVHQGQLLLLNQWDQLVLSILLLLLDHQGQLHLNVNKEQYE